MKPNENPHEDHRIVSVRPIQALSDGRLRLTLSDYLFFRYDVSLEDLAADRYYSKRLVGIRIPGRKLFLNIEDLPVLKLLLERLLNGEGMVGKALAKEWKPDSNNKAYAAAPTHPRATYVRDSPRPYKDSDAIRDIRDLLLGKGVQPGRPAVVDYSAHELRRRYFGLDGRYRR